MIPAAPLGRRIRRLLAAPIRTAATIPGADAYRKHFPASAHLWLLVWHTLAASPSLRQSHAAASADPSFWRQLGLPPGGISRSQLARSSTSRPLGCAETLLAELQQQVPATARATPAWGRVQLVDSTFVTLSAQLASWSQHGRHAPGLRVHTGFNLAAGIPDQLHFTLADTHDVRAFRERDWTDWRGWTVVIDRGYYAHPGFAELRAAGVSWLCPLHWQARVVVTAAQYGPWPLAPTGEEVLADELITLGSPHNRRGDVLELVRCVSSRSPTGAVHQLVSDRTDLSAGELVALYHQRWQIELFFRWLKHQLGVLHPLGYSRTAVELTLLLAAIVALLLVLLATERPPHLSDIAWVRQLGQALFLTLLRRESG
jgi:hypothetical protein